MIYRARTVQAPDPTSSILPKRQGQRDKLLEFLTRDGSMVSYAKNYEHHRGVLRVQPSQEITDLFGISLEIPIQIATWRSLEARILNRFADRDLRGAESADKDIAVLVAADDNAGDLVMAGRDASGYPILTIYISRLIRGYYSDATLSSEIAKLMRTTNHFDYSNDIKNSADFFGRSGDRQQLLSSIAKGQNVGVFGLRRAGKTSLMRQLSGDLKEKGTQSIFVPLNSVRDAHDLRIALVSASADILRYRREHENRKGLAATNSKMLNANFTINVAALVDVDAFERQWIYELDSLLDQIDADTVLMIDEIDFANERVLDREAGDVDTDYSTRKEMFQVLRTLRGLIQKRQDRGRHRLSLLVAGLSSSIFSLATRFGLENQFFGFGSIQILGPMDRNEMKEMVSILGKRSGVRFDDESLLDELYDEYGGLPYLTRQACATMVVNINQKPNREVPYRVNSEDLHSVFSSMAAASPSEAAAQTLESFSRWYPSEAQEIRESIRWDKLIDPSRIPQAIGLGLCDETGKARIKALLRRQPAGYDGVPDASMRVDKLLTRNESQYVEFKSTATWNVHTGKRDRKMEHSIIKTVCGFLNGRGGTLLIGVADDGSVVGLDADMQVLKKPNRDGNDVYERFVRQILDNGLSIQSAGFVEIGFETMEDMAVCVVTVSRYPKPVFAIPDKGDKIPTEFYVRVGNLTEPFKGNDAIEYQSNHWVN